jgi:hypothetical protein
MTEPNRTNGRRTWLGMLPAIGVALLPRVT